MHFGFADVSLTNRLSERGYDHFVSFMLSLTCVSVGLFSEVIGGRYIIKSASPEVAEALWKYAQLVFPLLIAVGYKSQSVFGLPFITLGLFKFGFPEIIGHFHFAFHPLPNTTTTLRVANFVNGIATVMHHSLATYVVCSFVVGTIVLNRHSESMVLPVITQHWFPVFRYRYPTFYIIAMLATELWWEMEVFSHLNDVEINAQIAVFGMVIAHWGYWTGGILEMVDEKATGLSHSVVTKLRRSARRLSNATGVTKKSVSVIPMHKTSVADQSMRNSLATTNPPADPSLKDTVIVAMPPKIKKTRSECDVWRQSFTSNETHKQRLKNRSAQPRTMSVAITVHEQRKLEQDSLGTSTKNDSSALQAELQACMELQQTIMSRLQGINLANTTPSRPKPTRSMGSLPKVQNDRPDFVFPSGGNSNTREDGPAAPNRQSATSPGPITIRMVPPPPPPPESPGSYHIPVSLLDLLQVEQIMASETHSIPLSDRLAYPNKRHQNHTDHNHK